MSAALDLLNAVKAIVEAANSGKTCHVRRGSEMNQAFWFDTHPPCFIATCNDSVRTTMAYAGKKFCEYRVTVGYYTTEQPRESGESSEVREVVEGLARLFLAPRKADGKPGLQGAPLVTRVVSVEPKGPYSVPTPNKTVNCSPVLVVFQTLENAN